MKEVICEIIPGLTLNGEILSEFYHPVDNLVRCKDCKWGEPTRNGKGEEMVFCYCGDTGIEDGWLLNPDWYCAEGEPKDGDGE